LKEPLFAVDSKRHHKEWSDWETGEKKIFDGLIGIVVNPLSPTEFEKEYSTILDDLFSSFNLVRTREVYKAQDIGLMFSQRVDAFRSFCLNFARKILSLDNLKVAYCVTRMNKKYLDNEKVTIYGEYGTATQQVSVREFIGKIQPYYNVICAWFVANATKVPHGRFLLDGEDTIAPSKCWNHLSSNHQVEIVFNGDRIEPCISTADILLRSLDFFLQQSKKFLDEDTIKSIILYDGIIPAKNKSFYYIGNPHLEQIKPISDRAYGVTDLGPFLKRPILFVGAGNIPGQKNIIENQPIFDKILRMARERRASLRFYDPKRDRLVIGKADLPDLFLPLHRLAENQLELLMTAGANVEKIEID